MRSLLGARGAARTAAPLKRSVRSQAGRAGASQPPAAGSSMAEPSLPGAALDGRAHTSGHEPAGGDDMREVPGAAAALAAAGGGALPIGRWGVPEAPGPPPPAAEGEGRRLQQGILPSRPAPTADDPSDAISEMIDREILDDLERAIYEEEGVLAWPPPPPLGGSPPPRPDGAPPPPPPPGRSTEQLAGEFDLSRAMP